MSEMRNIVKTSSVSMLKEKLQNKETKLCDILKKSISKRDLLINGLLVKGDLLVKGGLLVCLLVCILAWSGADWQKYGPFNMALNSQMVIKCDHDRSLNLDVSNIKIYFFDLANNFNKSFSINKAGNGILHIKKLDQTRKFIMFVGGFTSHIDHEVETQIREAYKTHPDSYLIIPDHSAYTNNNDGNLKSYTRSVTYVHYIGKALGKMLADLKAGGVSPKNIHCIGHSLGGQILGHTGTSFFSETGEKIARITALDPAGPCFTASAVTNQVRAGVADYVEVYHSNSGALGSASILGDVDFIMNKNGEAQPHCGTPIIPLIFSSSKAASCNHRICVDLWTAAVKNPSLFWAYRCESYERFKAGKCRLNEKTVIGPANPGDALGKYYLSTEMYNLKSLK